MTIYYKAYGAKLDGQIMSTKELDSLIAKSLNSNPNLPTNLPANPPTISIDNGITKPKTNPTIERLQKPSEPFAHLKAYQAKPSDTKKGTNLFAHLKER